MKIICTNWINLLGVFACVLFFIIIHDFIINDDARTIMQVILGSVFAIVLYGLVYWIGFILSLIVLDLIIIVPNKNYLKPKLLAEWLLISLPLAYYTIIYERQRWIFLIAITSFLITQFIRKKLIDKLFVK